MRAFRCRRSGAGAGCCLPVCLAAIVVLAVAAVIAVPKIRAAWAASRPAPLVTDVHWTEDGDFGWTMPKGGKAYSWIGIHITFENEARRQRQEDNQYGYTYACYRVDESNIASLYKTWGDFKEHAGSEAAFRFRVRLLNDPYDVMKEDESLWSEWSEWRTFG